MKSMGRINLNQRLKSWEDGLGITNRYTAGVAGERFLREIKDNGKIMGTKCAKCGSVYLPARMFCEKCFVELDEWVDLGTKGTLFSYSVVTIGPDEKPLVQPVIVGIVEFGSPTAKLIHKIGEAKPEELSVGQDMEVVLLPEGERKGSILDIAYVKPVR